MATAVAGASEGPPEGPRTRPDLRAAATTPGRQLRRLQSEIGHLQSDNELLRQQVRVAEGTPFGPWGSLAAGPFGSRVQRVRQLEALRVQAAALEAKGGAQQKRLEHLRRQSAELRVLIEAARQSRGGVHAPQEEAKLVEAQRAVLHGRLDKATVKFNEVVYANKQLRAEIDALRRERAVFDSLYKKLEKEMQEKKKEMAVVIETTNLAYEERDAALNELAQLKTAAAKEMASFADTFRELDELLEEDLKMKDALRQRMTDRKAKAPPRPASAELQPRSPRAPRVHHLPPLKALSQTQVSDTSVVEASPQFYEAVFRQIEAATGVADMDALIKQHQRTADENFSLFNYVNQLSHDLEEVQEACEGVRRQLQEPTSPGAAAAGEEQHQRAVQQLEAQLGAEEGQARRYASLADSTANTLAGALATVGALHAALEEEPPAGGALGPGDLTVTTLPTYLAVIEAKATDLLNRWRRSTGHHVRSPPLGGSVNSFHIAMPAVGDDLYEGMSEDEDRVLSREELAERTSLKLMHHQSTGENRRVGRKMRKRVGV